MNLIVKCYLYGCEIHVEKQKAEKQNVEKHQTYPCQTAPALEPGVRPPLPPDHQINLFKHIVQLVWLFLFILLWNTSALKQC